MRTINLDLDQSEAVVGWNAHGLAGYAVHKGDLWSCVAANQPRPARHVFRHGDAALRWLHEQGHAEFFESLADPRDLKDLIASPASPPEPDAISEITTRLSATATCD